MPCGAIECPSGRSVKPQWSMVTVLCPEGRLREASAGEYLRPCGEKRLTNAHPPDGGMDVARLDFAGRCGCVSIGGCLETHEPDDLAGTLCHKHMFVPSRTPAVRRR